LRQNHNKKDRVSKRILKFVVDLIH